MEKQKKIISMFDEIAKTYDIANRVLSFGVDKSWRKKGCNLAYKYLGKSKVNLIVDVACGTGDMMDFWAKIAKKNKVEVSKILGIDPSIGMVEVGKKKFPEFEFKIATATDLEIDDNSADIISIAYGIRNVVQRQEAFHEFNRVLKQDGLVVILEFMTTTNTPTLRKIQRPFPSES